MFQITTTKQELLTPLLIVAGAVDKKQSVLILSNILLNISKNNLSLTATDLEIEITANIACICTQEHAVTTIPVKKVVDIVRSLEDDAEIIFEFQNDAMLMKSGRSKFKILTLPAKNYPSTEFDCNEIEFSIAKASLIKILQTTAFAMALQDARIYLNGLFLEINSKYITAVAADGHRMAVCQTPCDLPGSNHRLIIPKKAVQEILRLLSTVEDETIILAASKNHFRLTTSQYVFSSKLIETRFPPYNKAVPKNQDKSVVLDRDILKRALSRIIIMANEKVRAISLNIEPNTLTILASNQDHEEGS